MGAGGVMIEEIKKTRQYLNYLEEHYNNVQKAWKEIQVKLNGKFIAPISDDYKWWQLDSQIKTHDFSKLSKEEFVQSRINFYPTDEEIRQAEHLGVKAGTFNGYEMAWENHKKHNSHHHETVKTDIDVVHMIVDWLAMSYKFNDTPKQYYEANKKDMKLKDWMHNYINEIFDLLGY